MFSTCGTAPIPARRSCRASGMMHAESGSMTSAGVSGALSRMVIHWDGPIADILRWFLPPIIASRTLHQATGSTCGHFLLLSRALSTALESMTAASPFFLMLSEIGKRFASPAVMVGRTENTSVANS
jgi:hypothetical protein